MSQISLARQLQNSFDSMFGIPFIVQQIDKNGHIGFEAYPADADREYGFGLEISFTAFRISIRFMPGRFSAHMIRQMGNASMDKKLSFHSYFRAALNERGELSLVINGIPSKNVEIKEWPTEWHHFELRLTRMPIVCDELDQVDYLRVAEHWGGYMLGMALSLLDVVPVVEDQSEGYAEGGVMRVSTGNKVIK